jgi:hypothetical protein
MAARIAARRRWRWPLERLGGVEHGAVVRAHGGLLLLALGALAVEGLVDGLAEGVPQLLLVAALQRHGLRLGLPALLQRAHGVDAQLRRGAQLLGLGNHAWRRAVLAFCSASSGAAAWWMAAFHCACSSV